MTTSKLQIIYSHFQSLPDHHEKILYLQNNKSELKQFNINVDKLIQHYLTNGDKPWTPPKREIY